MQIAADAWVGDRVQWQPRPVCKLAAPRQHHGVGVRVLQDGTDQRLGRHVQQGAQLCHKPGGKVGHAGRVAQFAHAGQHLLQALPSGIQPANERIRSQRNGDAGEQPGTGEFGLGLVVVDVEVLDRLDFRRIAWLPGAQDDPHVAVVQLIAYVADEVEARILVFHDHVHDGQGKVLLGCQDVPGLRTRVGGLDVELPAFDGHRTERERGGRVNIVVIVHQQHLPYRLVGGRQG